MYYRSVNRGLNFTRSGRYLIFITVAIGVLAVITGVNGMFIFLGMSLGLLAVSGVVSEKNLKHCELGIVSQNLCIEAEQAIELTLSLGNRSVRDELYGLEIGICQKKPDIGWWRARLTIIGSKTVLHLSKQSAAKHSMACRGLPRGYYQNLYALVRTTFPFGIFLKYKIVCLHSELYVYPAISATMLELWQKLLTQLQASTAGHEEFIGHTSYQVGSPLKQLDWRKNAGRSMDQWVSKCFRQSTASTRVELVVTSSYANSLDLDQFESLCCMLSCGLEMFSRAGYQPSLRLAHRPTQLGLNDCRKSLASVSLAELQSSSKLVTAQDQDASVDRTQIEVTLTGPRITNHA